MGTVPESSDEYYGPQPKYDYTWKGIHFLRGEFFYVRRTGLHKFTSFERCRFCLKIDRTFSLVFSSVRQRARI